MRSLCALGVAALLAGCSGESAPLTAEALEIRLPRPGTERGVAYLRLVNASPEAITITSVSSPQFAAVEMHETVITDGVSRMRKLDSVTIPATGTASFERGGKHLMLIRPVAEPGAVSITFHSDGAPVLTVQQSGVDGDE